MMDKDRKCIDCIHLHITNDISGYEAHCTANSREGRKITWQYGLNMDWCKRCVEESLEKAPHWCPVKSAKVNPCPLCGKAVEVKWACGMDEKTAAATRHPLNGKAGWYIEFCNGMIIYEDVDRASYEAQNAARKKLIKNWNMISKRLCVYEGGNRGEG